MTPTKQRVLVTGGGTFLGDNIAAALLAEGAEVTLLVRPGAEDRLGPLGQRARLWTADVWDPASLRGRARGHHAVVHTVGSIVSDPGQGLTHHRLNFLSARNVANMCVSDGVPRMVLLSSVRAPWVSREYIRAKREAEAYLVRVGLQAALIRAPVTYMRGRPRPLFYRFMSILGRIPPFSWLGFGKIAPLPVDVLARGVARIALEAGQTRQIYFAGDLRKRNKREELKRGQPNLPEPTSNQEPVHPIELLDEETPFGWMPDTNDE